MVRRILSYFIWTFIAFLAAFCYMKIILGATPEPATGLMRMFDWVYNYALVYVGSIIGSIIALLYILIDVFYLHKRLRNKANTAFIRLLAVILIAITVGTTHYILEKVIDII